MTVSERIAIVLEMIVKEGLRDFSILNIYKGVPFTTSAYLHSFADSHIWFKVQEPGLFCVLPDCTVFLLSDGLLDPIEAQVEEFVAEENLVRLSGFAFAGMRFSHRRDLRVVPEPPLPCQIDSPAGPLPGKIVDLTMRGVGIQLTNPLAEDSPGFTRNFTVTFTLPEGPVNLQGQVRRLRSQQGTTRLSVEFTGNEPEKSLVVRYLLQRRRQIVEEVNQMSAQLQRLN